MSGRQARQDIRPVVARTDDLLVVIARARLDERCDIAADVVDAPDRGWLPPTLSARGASSAERTAPAGASTGYDAFVVDRRYEPVSVRVLRRSPARLLLRSGGDRPLPEAEVNWGMLGLYREPGLIDRGTWHSCR